MTELAPSTQKLIQKYQAAHLSTQTKESVPVIHVDEVASAVAGFYEKIRGVVDWREEHLMRRAAIERVLKRRLLIIKESQAIAEPLIMELIRGGHFPNDRIPETKVGETQRALEKYIFILENSPSDRKEKMKSQLYDWLLSIAACEIEEILSSSSKERALIEFMMDSMKDKIKLNEGALVINGLSEEEKNIQVYIAVQRALFKLDNSIITYGLLKRKYPQWFNLGKNDLELQELTKNIYSIWETFDKALTHRLADKFYKICERYDTAYLILGDIISEDPMVATKTMETPENLEQKIISAYEKRAKTQKSRVGRAAFYATLSIFITKILLGLAIEVPFDRYISGQFSYIALGFSILTPPLLMSFLVLTIRPPKKENLQQVILEVVKITYETERKDVYSLKVSRKRGWLLNSILTLSYLATFIISFGLIILGLKKLQFGVVSIFIFLIFVSLISFAGTKLRERSKELDIIDRKDSFLASLIDFFSMPVISVGRWLSSQWTKYNILVIFFNFLIDMPFQAFIVFLEQWRNFLKEKKEEIH